MKKHLGLGILTLLAVLLVASTAHANIKSGMSEWNVMGSLNKMDVEESDATMIMALGTYNKFVSDNMSLGVSFMGTWMETTTEDRYGREEKSKGSQIFALGRGDYYFPGESDFVPYAGVRLGLVAMSNGSSESGLIYGPQAGIKRFLSENTSINFELQYSRFEIEEVAVNMYSFLVGLSVYY